MTATEKQNKFMMLFEPVYQNLWRFTLSLTHNREAARELLAETVAAAFAGFDKLKEEKAFLSFLFTIAVRLNRKSKAKSARELPGDPAEFDLFDFGGVSPETAADITLMHEALGRLPEKERESVLLHEIHGFSRIEIAEIQGTTNNTVKSRLARAKKKLAAMLGIGEDKKSVSEHYSEING